LGTGLGAVGGTAVGGLLGVTGTGAAVGTAVGAVGGLGYAAARRGKSVDLSKGTHLNIKLDHPSTIATGGNNQQRYSY
jgi:outer membrane lipoprotein SlyB